MKKIKYWKINQKAKYEYKKYEEITEEESKNLKLINTIESFYFIDKIFE